MLDYKKYANEWLGFNEHDRLQVFEREGTKLFIDSQFLKVLQKVMKEQEKKKYFYLLTFTLKPEADADKAEAYIRRVPERAPLQVTRCDLVKEHTKKGVAHWHMSVITTKALKKDRFSYYAQKFGHLDISKNKAQIYDEMLEYMTKEEVIESLK